MLKKKLVIVDLEHVVGASLPISDRTFYQSTKCWSIRQLNPSDYVRCVCGNVSIDVDAAKAGARDEQFLRVLQIAQTD